MNSSIKDASHPSIVYYDGDYPSRDQTEYPENFDEVVIHQGIADDVDKYIQLTAQYGKKVLELCCGAGRISIPLVNQDCVVTAVDASAAILKQFRKKVNSIPPPKSENLSIVKQDVTQLSLDTRDFDIVICGFNSLLCIADFNLQLQTLRNAADHLRPHGLLALDIWNPLAVNLYGDIKPEPFFTRKNPHNGNTYTRFAATGPMTINQVQSVYGWYDEFKKDGTVTRQSYHMEWRLIFRYEIQMMLEKAGFTLKAIYGGNHNEPLTSDSLKMFIEAEKVQ
jgi:ubiquinone/menaquinone biosynthesis C-methylase UbiE